MYLFGDWSLLTTLLYLFGIFLLLVEGMMPGFGVAGITGVIFVFASVVMITSNMFQALLLFILTLIVMVLIIIAMYKLGFGSKYMKFLVLQTEQKNVEGYTSAKDYKSYVGKTGISVSNLRPSGTIVIDGLRMDAVTLGDYIDKDQKVLIINVDANSLVVKRIEQEGV